MPASAWTAATLLWTLLAGGPASSIGPAAAGSPQAQSATVEGQLTETEPAAADQSGASRFFAYHDRVGGYSTQLESNVRLASQRVVATVGVELTSSRDSAQWIKNTDADGDDREDNVYGTLRRHEIDITTRATFSFTRDMTLEAYVQPFVAVGNYFDIRKLAQPKSFRFTPVTFADNPDFNQEIGPRNGCAPVGVSAGQPVVCGVEPIDVGGGEAKRGSSRHGATLVEHSARPAPIPSRSN